MLALYLGNATRSTYLELQFFPLKNNHKTMRHDLKDRCGRRSKRGRHTL